MTPAPHECLTCGDVAVVGTVVEVEGGRESVGVELVAPVEPGARLVCHAGIAIARAA